MTGHTTVKLVDIDDEPIIYPVYIEEKRSCPPEDVHGIYGYMDFLEIMSNPDNPEYEEMLEWADIEEPFDPDRFDLESVNLFVNLR
ncbi:MAG: plasmid pRiA4b ORF-3 family protein [Lentisphaerales bacterium]|nr:plasmid pRiA4b ORF-3 family protein [Lentisphaerales bacterium]